MQKAVWVAQVDVEIGDMVLYEGMEWMIYDILAIHSVKLNEVYFNFVLERPEMITVAKNRNNFKLIRRNDE